MGLVQPASLALCRPKSAFHLLVPLLITFLVRPRCVFHKGAKGQGSCLFPWLSILMFSCLVHQPLTAN